VRTTARSRRNERRGQRQQPIGLAASGATTATAAAIGRRTASTRNVHHALGAIEDIADNREPFAERLRATEHSLRARVGVIPRRVGVVAERNGTAVGVLEA